MSNSDAPAPVRLTARAEDESTRIDVLDGNLNLVPGSSRLGETSVQVPPGAYAVRFQIGSDYVQRVAILAPNSGETHVSLKDTDAPRFATSAPVRHTRSTRETHRGPAREISRSQAIPKCEGKSADSHLLVFARDLLEGRQNDPAQGLTLHDLNGTLVADFAHDGARDPVFRWAGAHLALPAGAWRLRLTLEGRRFSEQTIYSVKGWQTQVFLLAGGAGDSERNRRVQLDSASVLMARPEEGFDPERMDLRWTESALRALRTAGNIPGPVRSEMMWEKFQNPMLGIYAGLLHLRREKIDVGLMLKVFHNLMGLVGPLPDVLAIGWGLALRDAQMRADQLFMQLLNRPGDLARPPMLRASWELLVKASVEQPQIVPPGSFSERASQRLTTGGPWFSWRGEPPAPAQEPPPADIPGGLTGLLGKIGAPFLELVAAGGLSVALPALANVLAKYPMAGRLLYSRRYTDVERRVAQYVYPLVDPQLHALVEGSDALKQEALEGMKARGTSGSGLVTSLQISAGTAVGAVWSLMRKLLLEPVVPHSQMLGTFVAQESHENAVLESALKAVMKRASSLRHRRGGDPVNELAIVFLRYRGSPAAGKGVPPDPAATVRLLSENEYVIGDDAQEAAVAFLDDVVANVRKAITDRLARAVKQRKIALAEGWQAQVLPPPGAYKVGALLPTPVNAAGS